MITAALNGLAVLAALVACMAVLYAMARWVGLGCCADCRCSCPPWDAYCWRHRPTPPQ